MSKRPRLAHNIIVESCDCGCETVYLYLCDEKDRPFACAPLKKDIARAVAGDLNNAADAFAMNGEVAGHA